MIAGSPALRSTSTCGWVALALPVLKRETRLDSKGRELGVWSGRRVSGVQWDYATLPAQRDSLWLLASGRLFASLCSAATKKCAQHNNKLKTSTTGACRSVILGSGVVVSGCSYQLAPATAVYDRSARQRHRPTTTPRPTRMAAEFDCLTASQRGEQITLDQHHTFGHCSPRRDAR